MKFILLLMLFCSSAYADNNQVKRLFDAQEPIELKLITGQEVSMVFDEAINSIAIKDKAKSKIISESIDKRWWIKAIDDFTDTRILVKNNNDQITVFIVSSGSDSQSNDEQITKYRVIKQQAPTEVKLDNDSNNKSLSLVDLTRFAAQTFYAPKRLIKDISLNRVPVSAQKINLFNCQKNTWCVGISAKAIASWTDLERYVSVIEIKNISKDIISLDPRLINGDFISATFQFNRIGMKGSNTDTTLLYVVGNKTLEQSL